MPGTILGLTVIATKAASGNVLMQLLRAGSVVVEVVMPAADVTSLNTNVNGGSTGATRTFTYSQDQNKTDYDTFAFQET